VHYTLDDIFTQASTDRAASPLHGQGYQSFMLYGVKISRDQETKEIEILDTSRRGYFYHKLKNEELKVFLENGWRYGIYVLSLSNYCTKLDYIEKKIKEKANDKRLKSTKALRLLQEQRTSIMQNHTKITIKLNKWKKNKQHSTNCPQLTLTTK